jgi:hypothetical protein
MRVKSKLGLFLFAVVGLLVVLAGDVFAVVGRPATPVSAAGAARRTVRRGG